jgi:hypothetical protein
MILTPHQNELLICAIEEAAEVSQSITKALRFGFYETHPVLVESNQAIITREIGDFFGVIEKMLDAGLLDSDAIKNACESKLRRLDKWLVHKS